MDKKIIPARSEVKEEFTWNLGDMFADDEAWLAEFEALKKMPEKIAAFEGRLGESAQILLAYFKLDDELELRLSPFYGYASCKAIRIPATANIRICVQRHCQRSCPYKAPEHLRRPK